MDSNVREVHDEDGRHYVLEKKIKGGGQGDVYAVKDRDLAVKIVRRKGSESEIEVLRQQLNFVRRLPLEDLPIARPIKMLRAPTLGYVMELLSDMEPIRSLVYPPSSDSPNIDWFIKTGGLRRRLRVLASCAEVLNQLHGKALVYADLSPGNVLISCEPNLYETWLVDADNLRYSSAPDQSYIYTPGYGAPEIVTGKAGVNSLSDAFSFAVLAFKALTLVHPYVGDWVDEGAPELEDLAYRGNLPFVDAPGENRNRATRGLPRDLVLSPRLRELAQRAFVDGLHNPLLRPKPSEWAERLHGAADVTIMCRACSSTYYFNALECPRCGSPTPSRIGLTVCASIPSPDMEILESRPIANIIHSLPAQILLTNRVISGRQDVLNDRPVVEITANNKRQVSVRLLEDREFFMVSEDGRKRQLTTRAETYPFDWRLHLGQPEQRHRIVSFFNVLEGKS